MTLVYVGIVVLMGGLIAYRSVHLVWQGLQLLRSGAGENPFSFDDSVHTLSGTKARIAGAVAVGFGAFMLSVLVSFGFLVARSPRDCAPVPTLAEQPHMVEQRC